MLLGCHDVSVVVRVRIFVGRDETRVDHFLMFDPKKSEWISMPVSYYLACKFHSLFS